MGKFICYDRHGFGNVEPTGALEMQNEKWAKGKIDRLFASHFPIALLLECALRRLFGSPVKGAAWEALKQLNCFSLLVYFGLWFATATGKLKPEGAR
jgi:hypothetical protein